MGSRMRGTAALAVGILLIGSLSPAAGAAGVYVGVPGYALDVSGTFARVPVALEGAFDAVEAALVDAGVPPAEVAEIAAGFDDAVEDVEANLAGLPTLFPIPLVGGAVEFSLPLGLIHGLRVTGGVLTDGLIRGIAEVGDLDLPVPLFHGTIETEAGTISIEADPTVSTWMLSAELVSRLDLVVAGFTIAAGVDAIRGSIVPQIDVEVPPDWADPAAAVIAALHPEGLSWSSFGVTAGIGVEVGFPFLRLYADVRARAPIGGTSGWWDVRVAGWSALAGLVIRF